MTKDDLKIFCAKEGSLSPKTLYTAWSAGEYTFATNGHILVRVPRLADVPENPDAPSVGKLFPYEEPKEWFALKDLTIPENKMVECRNCDGDKIIWHKECSDCAGHECENCDGTGKVEVTTPVPVGCAHFQPKYLRWLQALPNCKLGPAENLKQAPFTFDGGDGLLMPMRAGS